LVKLASVSDCSRRMMAKKSNGSCLSGSTTARAVDRVSESLWLTICLPSGVFGRYFLSAQAIRFNLLLVVICVLI
jgi:hypothetical protein